MTYAQLKNILNAMSETELNCTATVYVNALDEFMPILEIDYVDEACCDVLDNQHPYLIID